MYVETDGENIIYCFHAYGLSEFGIRFGIAFANFILKKFSLTFAWKITIEMKMNYYFWIESGFFSLFVGVVVLLSKLS